MEPTEKEVITEPTFTMESVAEMITNAVNTAINGYDKRASKNYAKLSETFESRFNELAPKAASVENETDSNVMKRQIGDLGKKLQDSEDRRVTAEKHSALSKVLNNYSFVNDRSRELAFKSFADSVAVTSDGVWVLGDEPLEVGVKVQMGSLQGLLAPKNVNGTGASAGSAPSVTGQTAYKENMSKEEWTAANRAMFPDLR